jgi:hypothetical protein
MYNAQLDVLRYTVPKKQGGTCEVLQVRASQISIERVKQHVDLLGLCVVELDRVLWAPKKS